MTPRPDRHRTNAGDGQTDRTRLEPERVIGAPGSNGSPHGGPPPVLTEAQVARWRSQGYLLVDGLFDPEVIERLRVEAAARFPAPGSPEAAEVSDFGSALTFPADLAAFNRVTLDERLLAAVAGLLGVAVGDLRLTQSDLWPKYGRRGRTAGIVSDRGNTDDAHLGHDGAGAVDDSRYDNQDQRIHVDYPNHTLVHPAPWDRPEAVELILYLSDHRDCGGSTAVVPRNGPNDPAYRWPMVDSPGIGDLDWINDRTSAEAHLVEKAPAVATWRAELYRRERRVSFRSGTVLFYRHDTWHRGTPLEPGSMRLAHNMTFRRADCEWIATLHPGWSWTMYRPDKLLERLIAEATVDQRAVLGFPGPGSRYWCDQTIAAVEARYGPLGFDAGPYRAALDADRDV